MDIDNILIEADGDLVFVTVAKYKLFLSYGKIGMNAYLLYSHLMFTARLQKTDTVWAKDLYIRKGLNWGSQKLLKAKALLKDLNLIETIKKRDKKGKIEGWYIKVKTKTSFLEIEDVQNNNSVQNTCNPLVDEPTSGFQETNALTNKYKCLNKKVKGKFIKPSLQDLKDYCKEKGYNIDCEYFLDHYNANGWLVGKNKMKDWKATLRNWHRNKDKFNNGKSEKFDIYSGLDEEGKKKLDEFEKRRKEK